MAVRADRETAPQIGPREKLAAALVMAMSGGVWLDVLMQPRWAAAALGPICSHSGLLTLHCPACYAAAALIAGAAGLALNALASARTPAPAAIPSRDR